MQYPFKFIGLWELLFKDRCVRAAFERTNAALLRGSDKIDKFLRGRPKLGDVGLVTDVKPAGAQQTWVGTPGFMPPAPEPPGTVQADVYALGMVLYVSSTGREPAFFPELSATLVEQTEHKQFTEWNRIVLKACHPDQAQRYTTAGELLADLTKFQSRKKE